MQQAMDFLPSLSHMVGQMAQQPWWRDGIVIVSSTYVCEQTWELIVNYASKMYSVMYDASTDQCDAIEPLDDFLDSVKSYLCTF